MYLEHFGLSEPPFLLTPNTAFTYEYGGHREALNVLLVALHSGEGFVQVSGEVGTGKTLLCRALLRALGDEYTSAYVPHPPRTAEGMQLALAEELGVASAASLDATRLHVLLRDRLLELSSSSQRVVLLIDEAHTLPVECLEAVRLLSNLETETAKLVQIVLVGQPELDELLARPALRQLRQRIAFSYRLRALDRSRLEGYVHRRLRVSECRRELFRPRALDVLWRSTRGVPRLVNIVCHKALLDAFGRGDARVDAGHVRRAVADTDSLRRSGVGWRLVRRLLGGEASA